MSELDTMMEAGWHGGLAAHWRAIQKVRDGAALKIGHFVGPDKRHTALGGPVSDLEIMCAVHLIAALGAASLPAPHVYLLPRDDASSYVSLEWGRRKGEPLEQWDIDVTLLDAGWWMHGVRFVDHTEVATIDLDHLNAREVIAWLGWLISREVVR